MKQVRMTFIRDGDFQTGGRVLFKDGKISFEGLSNGFIETMKNQGVMRHSLEEGWITPPLFPKDGLSFLEALHLEFKGGHCIAGSVEEVEE